MEYRSTVQHLDEITKQIQVAIAATEVQSRYATALTKASQGVQIKGFRPGKAPKQLVESIYGARIREELREELISQSLQEIVEKEKLEIVGTPRLNTPELRLESEFEYSATVAVFPRPEIKGYEQIPVKLTRKQIKDEDIDQALESLRDKKATLKRIEFRTTAKKGDVIEGLLFRKAVGKDWDKRGEPVTVPLGAGNLPKTLEDSLEGLEIGQTREVAAGPEDSQAKKGPPAEAYRLVLNGLQEKIAPELSDEFAASIEELGCKTLLELRIKAREQLEAQLEGGQKQDLHTAIIDSLVDKNEFLVPEALIRDEVRGLLTRVGVLGPNSKAQDSAVLETLSQGLRDTALRRVRGAIIIDRVAELETLRASDEDIEKYLESVAAEYGVPVDEVRKALLSEQNLSGVLMQVTREKVLRYLEGKASIEYVEASAEAEAGATAQTNTGAGGAEAAQAVG
jgi:trigger factor